MARLRYIRCDIDCCIYSRPSSVDCVWNVMAHAQKPDFVFRRKGRAHLNRHGRQFSRLLAVEVCASAVVMLDTPSSEVVRRILATHSIRQFPLHFPSRASPCAITFQLDSTVLVFAPVDREWTSSSGAQHCSFMFGWPPVQVVAFWEVFLVFFIPSSQCRDIT